MKPYILEKQLNNNWNKYKSFNKAIWKIVGYRATKDQILQYCLASTSSITFLTEKTGFQNFQKNYIKISCLLSERWEPRSRIPLAVK